SPHGSRQRGDCLSLICAKSTISRKGAGNRMGSEARRRDRPASVRCALCEARTELGARRATIPCPHRSRKSRPGSFPHGRVGRGDYQRSATKMSLHLFSANGALLSLAWGNAPGFTWTEEPSALKARVINAMSRAFSAPPISNPSLLGRRPRLKLKSALSALNPHRKGEANIALTT